MRRRWGVVFCYDLMIHCPPLNLKKPKQSKTRTWYFSFSVASPVTSRTYRFSFHTSGTWRSFGTLGCLSCLHVVGADVLPCADLILGKGKWTGEIDGVVLRQTDNTWFCLQGVALAHSSPATRASKAAPRRWTVPSLNANSGPHSETIPGRLSRCGPRALCTTWSMHQAHLGETHTGVGVICLTQVHHVSQHTLTRTHTPESRLGVSHTHGRTCSRSYTRVNEMLSVHLVLQYIRYSSAALDTAGPGASVTCPKTKPMQ